MLPIYINLLGAPPLLPTLTLLYTLFVAGLMVSRLPVLSGKRVGKRVPPEMVLPLFVLVVLFFALLIAYPWWVLTIGTFCYLACLPLGWVSYREYERRDAAAVAAAASQSSAAPEHALQPPPGPPDENERPARLN